MTAEAATPCCPQAKTPGGKRAADLCVLAGAVDAGQIELEALLPRRRHRVVHNRRLCKPAVVSERSRWRPTEKPDRFARAQQAARGPSAEACEHKQAYEYARSQEQASTRLAGRGSGRGREGCAVAWKPPATSLFRCSLTYGSGTSPPAPRQQPSPCQPHAQEWIDGARSPPMIFMAAAVGSVQIGSRESEQRALRDSLSPLRHTTRPSTHTRGRRMPPSRPLSP